MLSTTPSKIAAAALAAVGLIHIALAPEYLGEAAYIGALFIVGGLAAVAAAGVLWRRDQPAAWALGTVIAAGMAVGFVLSRTVGLPGFHESEWELSGLVSLALEAGFLALAIDWARRTLPARRAGLTA